VNALFYAAEAAVDGLAQVHGIDTRKLHYLKASAARTIKGGSVSPMEMGRYSWIPWRSG